MKWYQSLQTKSLFFFTIVAILFIATIIVNFFAIKQSRLPQKAQEAIALTTDGIVSDLLSEQRQNERLVLDMAVAAGVFPSAKIAIRMLKNRTGQEVVSGGLWFEPHAPGIESGGGAYFFHRDGNGSFVQIKDYADHTLIPYRKMEFYVLGRHLEEGETFWTKVYTDPVTRVRMVTVVSPIYRDGHFIGVASVDIKLALRQNQLFAKLLASENYFYIRDRIGNFIIASDEIAQNRHRDLPGILLTNSPQNPPSREANTLSKESPEITAAEADIIIRELRHQGNQHEERLQKILRTLDPDPILHEKSVVAAFYFPHTGWTMVVGIPEHILLADMNAIYTKITVTTIIFSLFFILLGYLFVRRNILRPLSSLTDQIEQATGDTDAILQTDEHSEIGLLAKRFNERTRTLAVVREHDAANERLLLQQSKMAAMGEMLDAVAHQWKQPLNALSMYNDLLVSDFEDGEVDDAYIRTFRSDIQTQIDHMTDTLTTFRSFFRPNSTPEDFALSDVVEDVLVLAKDDLLKNTIDVVVENKAGITVHGSPNEFKHLLLNLISNAKDAFIENAVENRRITIRIIGSGKSPRLEFEDNAGGIPEQALGDIFKAHFTTKAEGKGTGIGLYMSMQIVQKHHAKMEVENVGGGARFTVYFSEEGLTKTERSKT